MDAQLTINYSQKEPSSALGLTIVKLCLSLSLSISQSLNLSLSLKDRDRAYTKGCGSKSVYSQRVNSN